MSKNALDEFLEILSDPRLFEYYIHYFDVYKLYDKSKVIKTNKLYAIEDFTGTGMSKLMKNLPYVVKIKNTNQKFFETVVERFVKKYKGHVFHPEGLYSEQIFGPVFDYQCQCGFLTSEIHKDKTCPICNVKCTSSRIRYQTIGFIELKIPVINPLFMFTLNKIVNITQLLKLTQSKNEPHQSFSQIMLFDLQKQKFVIPEEISFLNLPMHFLELQIYDKTPNEYF